MFKAEPTDVCMQHTGRLLSPFEIMLIAAKPQPDQPAQEDK